MQYAKLLLWMLWIHKPISIFFIFRGDKLRRPLYFHFKIKFVIDFTETKEGLIQGPTVNWKRNAVNNFTRGAPQLRISHNATNNPQRARQNKWEKLKDWLKDIFYCRGCWVSIELMLQKVSGNLNFMNDSQKHNSLNHP